MRIYFGTNRNPDNQENPTSFGKHFSPQGLTDLRYGWADVADDNFDHYTLTVAREVLKVDEEKALVGDLSGQILGSDTVFKEVREEMKRLQQDCILYIHGYNCLFENAIKSTAQLKSLYPDKILFLFSWPSDGEMFIYKPYISDRDDARASGAALGRGLQRLAEFIRKTPRDDYCNQNIHLFAHSMGSYALRHALQSIKSSAGNYIRRLLDQIILFAADEDDDSFELDYKFQPLPEMARRVSVYHNAGDKALLVSDVTKSNPDRLGASGPRNTRLLPDKVSVINCAPVLNWTKDPTGHNYYLINATVKKDVIAVLAGMDPNDIATREYQPEFRRYKLKQVRKN